MISHTLRYFPHETRVSHCARTDSNRRPLGSKESALLCKNSYNLSCLVHVVRGKYLVGSMWFAARNAAFRAGFPTGVRDAKMNQQPILKLYKAVAIVLSVAGSTLFVASYLGIFVAWYLKDLLGMWFCALSSGASLLAVWFFVNMAYVYEEQIQKLRAETRSRVERSSPLV